MENSVQDETKNKRSLRILLFSTGIFLIAFISGILSAASVGGYMMRKIDDEWLKYHGIMESAQAQHLENLLYATHATELINLAESRDYEAIFNKACWLLMFSIPKIQPDVWEEGTPRKAEDEQRKNDAQEALQDLFEAGYCPEYTHERIENIQSK